MKATISRGIHLIFPDQPIAIEKNWPRDMVMGSAAVDRPFAACSPSLSESFRTYVSVMNRWMTIAVKESVDLNITPGLGLKILDRGRGGFPAISQDAESRSAAILVT